MNKTQYLLIWMAIIHLFFVMFTIFAIPKMFSDVKFQYILYGWVFVLVAVYYPMLTVAAKNVRR
jgi:uncharacterized membrane protein YhaH (DUF805 family)